MDGPLSERDAALEAAGIVLVSEVTAADNAHLDAIAAAHAAHKATLAEIETDFPEVPSK